MAQRHSPTRLVVTALVLAALSVSVPFLANRLRAKGTRFSPGSPQHQRRTSTDETDDFFGFVASLPSYQALAASLRELTAASSELLTAAGTDDPEAPAIDVRHFRDSLRRTTDHFEALRDRVGRERAEAAFEQLSDRLELDGNLSELILGAKPKEPGLTSP